MVTEEIFHHQKPKILSQKLVVTSGALNLFTCQLPYGLNALIKWNQTLKSLIAWYGKTTVV